MVFVLLRNTHLIKQYPTSHAIICNIENSRKNNEEQGLTGAVSRNQRDTQVYVLTGIED
jgi:hypothetical protein